MTLYRAKPADGVAWITGASTGIGRVVALQLAAKGWTVAATARSVDKLEQLARESEVLSGRIVAVPADVTDRAAMAAALETIESGNGPVALAIFNAGDYWPSSGHKMDIDNYRKTYEINVFGVLNGLVPLVERFKQRRKGHVMIVGSVSGYGGLPMASAYGATKSAVNNMAAALKFDFDQMNIRIQMVNPGFIDTPLTEKNDFPMPALMQVDKAAARIVSGIDTGGFEVSFPRRFTWILKLVNLLPHRAYFPLIRRATGWKNKTLRY
jgi:NADP-dependent 3-hydroxy acid dehydrogenase YdfG